MARAVPAASQPQPARAQTAGPLQIRRLQVRAGSAQLLAGIDLTLHPGELCALIGPSGAGKSTLIKALLGLRAPQVGDVQLNGKPLSAAGPVGYVPQKDELHASLTVDRALHYAALLRLPELDDAQRKARIELLLKEVGLLDRRELRIDRLSGGQQKRVSVAIELLASPSLIILDEPTSGLDPGLEAQLMSLFQGVARQGRIVLVATHAMESIDRCDALLILVQGNVAYFGRPKDALAYFQTTHLAAVFPVLTQKKGADWAKAFAAHPLAAPFRSRAAPALPGHA